MTHARLAVAALVLASLCAPAAAAPRDPLDSPVWDAMRQRYLGEGELRFDERVRVDLPPAAENPLAVPVEVHAALPDVRRIVVIADLNPIPKMIDYTPVNAAPSIAFRFKVEQSTPVRAAVQTGDGIWHVGGVWLTAGGGGCTAPSQGTGSGQWQDHLGEVSARLWPEADGGEHLKLRVIHPMDTGLAGGIPVFHIEHLTFSDESGAALAQLKLYEPVAENPLIDVHLATRGAVRVDGVDTNGNRIAARVSP